MLWFSNFLRVLTSLMLELMNRDMVRLVNF